MTTVAEKEKRMTAAEKMVEARCRLLHRVPFYGHFAIGMKWIPSNMSEIPEKERTMGVRIMSRGDVECLYYPPFVESLTCNEVYSVIQHEIEHIVRLHCLRERSSMNHKRWNYAVDFCVNGKKGNPRIGFIDDKGNRIIAIPDHICWIPDDWEENETAEYYYKKLEDSKASCPKTFDVHAIWQQSTASKEDARQIVDSMASRAATAAQGVVPAHLVDILQQLKKPAVNWRDLLRSYIGRHVGNVRRTYSRANRRWDQFGIPGRSHHAAATVNVIVDTSGSITKEMLEQFFAEIDAIAHRAVVDLLQWDCALSSFERYHKNGWRNIKIKGGGGTSMKAAMEWLIAQGRIANCQIMLTDGFTDWIEPQDFPMITVITELDEAKVPGPGWGQEVRMNLLS